MPTKKQSATATSLMGMAMMAIAAGIGFLQTGNESQMFTGVVLVAVGVMLVALHYLTGL